MKKLVSIQSRQKVKKRAMNIRLLSIENNFFLKSIF